VADFARSWDRGEGLVEKVQCWGGMNSRPYGQQRPTTHRTGHSALSIEVITSPLNLYLNRLIEPLFLLRFKNNPLGIRRDFELEFLFGDRQIEFALDEFYLGGLFTIRFYLYDSR